jgi:hypothetical protein
MLRRALLQFPEDYSSDKLTKFAPKKTWRVFVTPELWDCIIRSDDDSAKFCSACRAARRAALFSNATA